jgi:hypothetical protein
MILFWPLARRPSGISISMSQSQFHQKSSSGAFFHFPAPKNFFMRVKSLCVMCFSKRDLFWHARVNAKKAYLCLYTRAPRAYRERICRKRQCKFLLFARLSLALTPAGGNFAPSRPRAHGDSTFAGVLRCSWGISEFSVSRPTRIVGGMREIAAAGAHYARTKFHLHELTAHTQQNHP